MKSTQLKKLLAPLKMMVSRNAMNPIYRCIDISPNIVRACSSYGIVEVVVDLGMNTPVYVDSGAFLAIIDTLPSNQDFELSTDDTSLIWACGRARGSFAKIIVTDMPTIEWPADMLFCPIPGDFAKALDLGSIACDNVALSAIDMFGIVADQRSGVMLITSTDNLSISTSRVSTPLAHAPAISTLPPDGAALLANVISPDGVFAFDEKAWYYIDEQIWCKIMMKPPLKSDIQELAQRYLSANIVAPLALDRLNAFIKRANALAETKRSATVGLSLSQGRVALSFKEGASTSDEYFLVDSLVQAPDMPEILLSASRTARVLSHVTEVVLDNLPRGVIVFRGHDPEFNYILSGKLVSEQLARK